jgi:hypothetical protein
MCTSVDGSRSVASDDCETLVHLRRSTRMRSGVARLLLCLLVLLSLASWSDAVTAAPAAILVHSDMLADASGQPFFALGVNYEGPADRAWHMWDGGQFDAGLIAKDLDRASAANARVVRVFVQPSLASDIRSGKFDKLDRFLDLADQRSLRIIVTLADYADASVANLASIGAQIAAHTRGRSTILSLDLKNEPHFGDLALANYPPGVNAALQDPATVAAVGESVARQDIPDFRSSDEGRQRIPARLTDDQAYVYINVLHAYLQFTTDAQAWAISHHTTVVQYMHSADSAKWRGIQDALNDTLAAWLKPQLDAIRAADPGRLITLAQVDPFLASLPVNDWLDYRTLHRYPTASADGIRQAVDLFDAVKASDPSKPLVLGEFGFSNDVTSEQAGAQLEVSLVRMVRDHGGAGALKWMLNDVPNGGNAKQDAFGMFRGDGSAKPIVDAFKALGALAPVAPAPPVPAVPKDQRYFSQTGYRIDDDTIWNYFQKRGQIDIFGYPISRTFTLLGCRAQMFQRQIIQMCADGQAQLMNILDPEVFPYTRVNGSTFPAPDMGVKQSTPSTSDPLYSSKIVDFLHATTPDDALGQPVQFGHKFFSTISQGSVPGASPGVLPLLDLEVWGAPISKPAADPHNSGFIYQRFQRGIMHYIAAQHTTQTILVADYLKQILTNDPNLPVDLKQEAQGTRFASQYCREKPNWLCRPADLPGTDLTAAFEPS